MDKINFQDIQAEHINRYQLVPVPGTTDQFDVVPVRGSVTNEGTPVRALELNQLQENIEDGFISVSGGQLKGDLVPYGTSINLGSSGARWQMVCANTINASNGAFTNLMVNSQSVWHAGNLQIAIGTVSITPSTATTPASQVVSFGKTFSAPPNVILTATNSENAHVFSWSTSNITTTQFTAHVSNSAGAYPSYANWVAIGI